MSSEVAIFSLSADNQSCHKLALYATPPLSPTVDQASISDTPLGRYRLCRSGGMEGDDPQRRHYEQSSYSSSGRVYGQRSGMASGSDVSDRYRQAQISSLRAPTSVPQASVAEQNQGNAGYGYTQGQQQYAPQLQGTAVQFQPDFPSDPQRVQQFPQYASSLVYNLPQQPQTPQQSPYDSVQQFQPRQSAAIEVLSNQFGVPQYYPIGDVASAPGPSSQSYAAAPFQQSMAYQPTQASRSTLSSSYAVGAADYAQSTMPTVLETQNAGSDDSGYDAAYNQYLDALRRTFQDVKDGRLIEAGQCLLEVSEWLLGHAGDLGEWMQ